MRMEKKIENKNDLQAILRLCKHRSNNDGQEMFFHCATIQQVPAKTNQSSFFFSSKLNFKLHLK